MMELPPLPLPPLPPKFTVDEFKVPLPRKPSVLSAEDIPGYWEFLGWRKAQQELADEGVLMSYPVGHARLAAVEERRLRNLSKPFVPDGPMLTKPLLPPPLPPRLPCFPN